MSSDHSDDNDEEDEDGEDCAYNEELRRRILKEGAQAEFDTEEFENISSNTRLRDVYSYRWWQDSDTDNYFVMINRNP